MLSVKRMRAILKKWFQKIFSKMKKFIRPIIYLLAIAAAILLISRKDPSAEVSIVDHSEYIQTLSFDDGTCITWIQDNSQPRVMPISLFPEADPALVDSLGLRDGFPSTVSVFLLEKEGKKMLFDTGLGAPDSRLQEALSALGIVPESIDYIFLTHCHGDHIGGLISGGDAVFPSAEVCLSVDEYSQWKDSNDALFDLMLSSYAGRIKTFSFTDALPDGVRPISASGHTEGHTVYEIGDVLVVGDILHGAALQMADPEICARYDQNPDLAVRNRRSILDYARMNRLTMAGMHFPAPGFIRHSETRKIGI